MHRLFLVLAWRNLMKRKFYSILEITGLAVGFSCILGASMYIRHELTYDGRFSKANSIYRIIHINEVGERYSGLPSALGFHIRDEVPQVKEVVRVFWLQRMFSQNILVQNDSIRFYENQTAIADSTFFNLFNFKFLEGSPGQSLSDKKSVVLSQHAAQRYFGSEPAYGKMLRMGDDQIVFVSGVVADQGSTHLAFDFLQPVQAYPHLEYTWDHTLAFTYVQVDDVNQVADIEKRLYGLVLKHSKEETAEYLKNYRHVLQPLKEVHHTVIDWDIINATSVQQLNAVGLIALFILVLAIINFVNLSSFRLTERMHSMGINSIMGADPTLLIRQIHMEYAITIVFAAALGALFLVLLFPQFNLLVGASLTFRQSVDSWLVVASIITVLSVLLLSGIYPVIKLRWFRPIDVLRNSFAGNMGDQRFRQLLVIFQFLIASCLISSTLIVNSQVNFLRAIELGFDKDQVIVLRLRTPGEGRFNRLKQRLLSHADIAGVAGASTAMGLSTGSNTFHPDHMPHQTSETFANTISVDYDFLNVMDIKLLQGRNFNPGNSSDLRTAYIINESAVQQYNLPEPVGERFVQRGQNDQGRIIGVVKNFYFESTSRKINALVLNVDTVQSYRYMFVKAKTNVRSVIRHIENCWKDEVPEFPLEFSFQDDYLNRLYEKEKYAQHLTTTFAVLAILVALLGFLGLSSFMILKRTKEIGVRKVIGASVGQILVVLCVGFVKLIAIALVVSIPLTYFFMNQWLEAFVNRIQIHPLYFLSSGTLTILLALIVVGSKSIKSAMANPVHALRND